MLITFIVTVAILAVLYLLIYICHKKIAKPNYEFSTEAIKSLRVFVHILFGISFSVIAAEIIICFFFFFRTALWVIFGIFLFFAILELAMLCDIYINYEAINGDEVYIHRFFRIKKIKVNDIRRIGNIGSLLMGFYGKYDKCLFLVDLNTKGVSELIGLINERKSDKSDESLENKHKFTNKKIKGASGDKFKKIFIVCTCFMILGIAFMLPLLGILGEEQNYDELIPITGKLEYYRETTGSGYIAIGFYDMPTEYRLCSIYLDEFDYSFFDKVKAGDSVTILVDNSKDREFSLRDVSKKQWNDFYYLEAYGKEYFTYEDYIRGRDRNNKVGFIFVVVGTAAFVAATVTLISAYFVCKKRKKEEDIVI